MKRKTYSEELNFVTLTVVDWIDLFTKRAYSDFVMESLYYCMKEKNLQIYAFVLMTNHLHMIVKAKDPSLPDVLRDFKSFTSKKIFEMVATNPQEGRKGWMLKAFRIHGMQNELNRYHQLWQNGSHPVALFSNKVIQQKLDYIHDNPVRAGFVDEASKYFYSSANPNNPLGIKIQ